MRVFKPLSARERAQAEAQARVRGHAASLSDIDKIVLAKAAIANRADRPQGMKPGKTYRTDADYERAYGKRPQTIPRADRILPTVPHIEIPRLAHYGPSRDQRYRVTHTIQQIREYSGISRKDKRK